MTDLPTTNRWIISYNGHVAKRYPSGPGSNIWWMDKTPGQPLADDTTIVYVKDMGDGHFALQTHGAPGSPEAYVSMVQGEILPPPDALAFTTDPGGQWITQPSSPESFQLTPTGDGDSFTMTCPFRGLSVHVQDGLDMFAQGWVMQGTAAAVFPPTHFTATGLDRPAVLDFMQIGRNATGMSLAGLDLSNMNLAGCNLSRCDFRQVKSLVGCVLTGANLEHANFTGCNLTGVKFGRAKLAGADLGGADLADADFTGTDLTGAESSTPLKHLADPGHRAIFTGCTVPYALIGLDWSCFDLTGATVTGIPVNAAGRPNLAGLNAQQLLRPGGDFTKLVLDGADFTRASLRGANFSGASLQAKASFAGAELSGASFIGATFDQADFTGATLDGADRNEAANFSYAYFSNCVFTGAGLYAVIFAGATLIELTLSGSDVNLQQVDFSDAYLPNSDFTGADLQGAKFDGACMIECNLTNADLTPAAEGTLQVSLAAACLQGAILTGTKLGGASLPNAVVTDADGQFTVQYYDEDGTLTDPYPMPYSGTSYPDPSSLSDTTVCPNTETYQVNHAGGLTMAQMMTAPKPPTQWVPRNTISDREKLAASIGSLAPQLTGRSQDA